MKNSKLKEIAFKITGTTPLLTNNPDTSDPLGPYIKAKKPITSKRDKTDDDHRLISRLGWEMSLYLYNGSIQLPARIINKMIIEGAKLNKKGKNIKEGLFVRDSYHPLRYPEPVIQGIPKRPTDPKLLPMPELDEFYDQFCDRRQIVVDKKRVWASRAIFENWNLEFIINFQEDILNREVIIKAIEEVGRRIGICEHNIDNFGRFDTEIIYED